ncbi:MAG TPA: RluA family pseudouridine synthase [Paludibacteraceae bacterium]|nr:RluA family pseudouridine synthase [Paludibacteraceae bacterium]HOU68922.1 RluA family pseudouridine synthase [Paludibacteraceae bacterium]HQF50685.1 RluA family pseudouridine synthase [Paludibacteraceae bacterium]
MFINENTPRVTIKVKENQRLGKKKERLTTFHVKEDAELFDYVLKKMGSMSKTAVKALLTNQRVRVNDRIVSQYNHPLKNKDVVTIIFSNKESGLHHSKLKIIYEDDYIIVVNKSEGLLSVATEKNETATAFRILMNHLKKQSPKNRLFVVHRLDRETSGVLLFAKNKEVQEALQNYWQYDVYEKIYYAIVEGCVEKSKDTIISWLTESQKTKMVYSSPTDNGGDKAITRYEVVKKNENFSLLKVFLETGKKNQIRVQMQSIGHPIVGDKKYGSTSSPLNRVGLHAAVLTLRHPVTGEKMKFEVPLPANMKMQF